MIAGLAEQSRLLVARSARDLDRAAEQRRIRLAVDAAGRHRSREHTSGDVQLLQDLVVPLQRVDVKEHRAGGVGIVGDVHLAARQLPDEPRFDCAEQQLAALRTLTRAWDVFEQPVDLRAGEIGVDDEAGLGAEAFRQTLGLQTVAVFARAAALPDDGVVDGLACDLIPDDGGLALVGDADGSDVGGSRADLLHGLDGYAKLRSPDLICVVLDPAGLRKVLGEFALRDAAHFAALIEKNAAIGSRASVQGHDVFCHEYVLLIFLADLKWITLWWYLQLSVYRKNPAPSLDKLDKMSKPTKNNFISIDL